MYACDLRKPAVSRIHLLKRMTLELREIQALRIIRILMELISFGILGRGSHNVHRRMKFSFGRLALFDRWIDSGKYRSNRGLWSISDNLRRHTFFLRFGGHCELGSLGIEKRVDVKRPRPWGASGAEQVGDVTARLGKAMVIGASKADYI